MGAGTGRYSVQLAGEGYDVTAVELVKYNLGILKSKKSSVKAYQGNALNLSRFEADQFDMVLGANEVSILVGLCISGWIETARIVRGEVMRIKEREFVLASRLAGAGPLRIFLTHLLPNAAGPIVVSLTFLVPQAIFTEAFLSFMGVGIPAPGASLGTMIQAARSQIFVYPYQMLIPTVVLCILILSLNLIGAGLEAKIRRRREGM